MTATVKAMRTANPESPRAICGAKTRSGKPCQSPPVAGAKRCRMHGASGVAARTAAAANVLSLKINGELEHLGWEPVTDPVAEYSRIGGEVLAFKDAARRRVNELLDWETPASGLIAEDTRAAVQVYERALDRAERTIGRMVGHGLTVDMLRTALLMSRERPTREQAETLGLVISAVLSDPRVHVDPGDVNAVVLDALKGLES